MSTITIRPATPDDVAVIVAMIRELAVFEKLEDQALATEPALREHLFGSRPFAEALIAAADTQTVGFALYFHTYSTFRALPSLYLEDLFVRESHRGLGVGKALLQNVARLAVERGCGRLEWAVLDWNANAIAFYRSLGARPMDDWTTFRLDDQALTALAAQPVETKRG